jgi:transposase
MYLAIWYANLPASRRRPPIDAIQATSVLRLKSVQKCWCCLMGRRGRPKADLALTDEERVTLRGWARRAKSAQALALRSRIVLACAEPGATNTRVAAQLGVSMPTVGKWRRRFVQARLAGLVDAPRPGRPPSVTLEQVEEVIAATLESKPVNATHWSRASMAKKSGLSKSTIGRIWRDFEIKPHLSDGFKLSTDPLFVDKVVDVVGLYHNPPENAVVFCVDEKSQIQALDRSQPVLPMMPGMPERRSHDYHRHGVTSLFPAFNIADGTVITEIRRRHRAVEYKKFLVAIDKAVPAELDVHLVCDNLSTHKTPAIKAWLARHPRFHVHFTPTGSSGPCRGRYGRRGPGSGGGSRPAAGPGRARPAGRRRRRPRRRSVL